MGVGTAVLLGFTFVLGRADVVTIDGLARGFFAPVDGFAACFGAGFDGFFAVTFADAFDIGFLAGAGFFAAGFFEAGFFAASFDAGFFGAGFLAPAFFAGFGADFLVGFGAVFGAALAGTFFTGLGEGFVSLLMNVERIFFLPAGFFAAVLLAMSIPRLQSSLPG